MFNLQLYLKCLKECFYLCGFCVRLFFYILFYLPYSIAALNDIQAMKHNFYVFILSIIGVNNENNVNLSTASHKKGIKWIKCTRFDLSKPRKLYLNGLRLSQTRHCFLKKNNKFILRPFKSMVYSYLKTN